MTTLSDRATGGRSAAPAALPTGRRSCLSVPASDQAKMAKAFGRGADEVIFDLEDAVAPDRKDAARALAATVVAAADRRPGVAVAVRVNAPRGPWCHLDLAACAGAGTAPLSVIVPKVESAGDLAFVDRLLDGAEAAAGRPGQVRVQALIETAAGLSRAAEIAAASPRLDALILGYADLGASLGRSPAAPPVAWAFARDTLLTAARAHGVAAIDGPFLGTADDEAFRAHARLARELGFDGKWVIHPAQIAAVNALFTPTESEIDHARAVLAALARGAAEGRGAVSLDGQMLDEAIAVAARRTLAQAAGAAYPA